MIRFRTEDREVGVRVVGSVSASVGKSQRRRREDRRDVNSQWQEWRQAPVVERFLNVGVKKNSF